MFMFKDVSSILK